MDIKAQRNRERMTKYRRTHRRIDYVPSPEALAAIELHKAGFNCMAGAIDDLITAGAKAITGNSK